MQSGPTGEWDMAQPHGGRGMAYSQTSPMEVCDLAVTDSAGLEFGGSGEGRVTILIATTSLLLDFLPHKPDAIAMWAPFGLQARG